MKVAHVQPNSTTHRVLQIEAYSVASRLLDLLEDAIECLITRFTGRAHDALVIEIVLRIVLDALVQQLVRRQKVFSALGEVLSH